MIGRGILGFAILVGALLSAGPIAADEPVRIPSDLPEDAGRIVAEHEEEAAEVRRRAEETIATKRAELIRQLEKLQDQYARAGRLEEAVAIRDRVRELRGGGGVYRVGQEVEVLWGGTWWKATILKLEGDRYRINYTGWDARWDESIPAARIRVRP